MPRGIRRKGAYAITLWLEDGAKLMIYTDIAKSPMTDKEIAADIRERLWPILDRMATKDDR